MLKKYFKKLQENWDQYKVKKGNSKRQKHRIPHDLTNLKKLFNFALEEN
jgi:hypothetical protein